MAFPSLLSGQKNKPIGLRDVKLTASKNKYIWISIHLRASGERRKSAVNPPSIHSNTLMNKIKMCWSLFRFRFVKKKNLFQILFFFPFGCYAKWQSNLILSSTQTKTTQRARDAWKIILLNLAFFPPHMK